MWRLLSIFVFVAAGVRVSGQEGNIFTYPEFDAQLVSMWIQAEKGAIDQLTETYVSMQTTWDMSKEQMLRKELRHFNVDDFVLAQDKIILAIEPLVSGNRFREIAEQSYIILQNFREVRTYFTSDLYPLDELLCAFRTYDRLHSAVDDPMFQLYEWNELIQLFNDFKKQFKRYVVIAEPGFTHEKHVLYKLAVQRVFECSEQFEAALDTAQQDDFVAPCDDTRNALLELVALYRDVNSNL